MTDRHRFSIADLLIVMFGVGIGLAGGTWMPADLFAAILGLVTLMGLLVVHLFPPQTRLGKIAWSALVVGYITAVGLAQVRAALARCSRPTPATLAAACYDAGMLLHVEFYGIARQRAGLPHLELELPAGETTLGEALRQIGRRLPEFSRECLTDGRLPATLAANLGGQRFVSDPALVIREGQSLLILSADAGG